MKTASKGSAHGLELVQVERAHGDQVLAARAREPQPDLLHRLDVVRPLVDERHVVTGLRQEPAHDAADRPHPDDPDARRHESPPPPALPCPSPAVRARRSDDPVALERLDVVRAHPEPVAEHARGVLAQQRRAA